MFVHKPYNLQFTSQNCSLPIKSFLLSICSGPAIKPAVVLHYVLVHPHSSYPPYPAVAFIGPGHHLCEY